jgi:hypothetical protein
LLIHNYHLFIKTTLLKKFFNRWESHRIGF